MKNSELKEVSFSEACFHLKRYLFIPPQYRGKNMTFYVSENPKENVWLMLIKE